MNNKSLTVNNTSNLALHKATNLMARTNAILAKSKRSDVVVADDNFVLIKAGSFMMGSEAEEAWDHEKPLHKVSIKEDFYMSKYQVTMKEYREFTEATSSHYPEWEEEGSSYNLKTGDHDYYKNQNFNDDAPIIGISWEDAKAYCVWRSQKEGKTYRLPTEAQWEYACRAGTTTKYSFGDEESKLGEYAWYDDNANGKAHPVGDKKPNPWGLYDMHGNVWEWCEDEWSDSYDVTPRDGSGNKSGSSAHSVRGGSWYNDDWVCRSSVRNGGYNWNGNVGFRLVLVS